MLKKIIDFVHESYKSIVYHTPKEKLNNSEIEKIKLNGSFPMPRKTAWNQSA